MVHDAIIQLIETVVPLLIKSNKEYLKSNMKYYLCSWLIHYDSKDSNHLSVHLSNFFLNKTLIPNILFKIITNLLPICKNQKISKTVKKIIFYTIFKIL